MNTPQRILVTGASSGFGRLTATTLARAGHTVFATMRQTDGKNASARGELDALARDEELLLHVLECDIIDEESVAAAVGRAEDLGKGALDVVVNNAGVVAQGITEGYKPMQLEALFDVNVIGAHRVNRAALPAMRARGSGLLIHVTSTIGRFLFPFMAAYCATKFALEAYAEGLRYEVGPLGIESVIVEPGAFPTNLMASVVRSADADRVSAYGKVADIPAQISARLEKMMSGSKPADPQQVADAIQTLIDTPAGERPVRTVVDPFGKNAQEINEVAARVQGRVDGGLGVAGD
jgi:NAD(P)-dependent dehydrogenase (short-subunit alcohol dehydrogenase family)